MYQKRLELQSYKRSVSHERMQTLRLNTHSQRCSWTLDVSIADSHSSRIHALAPFGFSIQPEQSLVVEHSAAVFSIKVWRILSSSASSCPFDKRPQSDIGSSRNFVSAKRH